MVIYRALPKSWQTNKAKKQTLAIEVSNRKDRKLILDAWLLGQRSETLRVPQALLGAELLGA